MSIRKYSRVQIRPAPRIEIPFQRKSGVVSRGESHTMRALILGFSLIFFSQIFHYTHEYPPPYYLSKVWPVLMFPFTLFAVVQLDLPGRNLFYVLLAYMMGFTPLVSIMQLGNYFFDALTTTVKVWSFSYYFALSGLLVALALPTEKIRQIFMVFGVATFIAFVVLWNIAPDSWYAKTPDEGKLLQYDGERGNRVYLSTIFGMIFVFYLGRSFIEERKWRHLLYMLVCFVIMLLIYKQRTAIAAGLLVTGIGMVWAMPEQWRRLIMGAGVIVGLPLMVVGLGYMGLFTSDGWDRIADSIGGSLSVRQNSSALVSEFLGASSERWVFGVGATTRFGSFNLSDIFGYSKFFVSDLGWLGVLFEYGLIGSLLILGVHVWACIFIYKNAMETNDRFQFVMGDYVLYLILTSSIYSLVFVPGELGVVLAVALYVYRQSNVGANPVNRSGWRRFYARA